MSTVSESGDSSAEFTLRLSGDADSASNPRIFLRDRTGRGQGFWRFHRLGAPENTQDTPGSRSALFLLSSGTSGRVPRFTGSIRQATSSSNRPHVR